MGIQEHHSRQPEKSAGIGRNTVHENFLTEKLDLAKMTPAEPSA